MSIKLLFLKTVVALIFSLFFLSCQTAQEKKEKPYGIISLTPALTSILVDLKLEEKIIAITKQDFVLNRPVVGSMIQFSLERILSLNPQYVVYQDFQKPWIQPILNQKNIKFIEIPLSNIDSIFKAVQSLSLAFDLSDKILESKQLEFKSFKNSLPPFFFLAIIDKEPSFFKIYATGSKSYLSEILSFLGGKNILEEKKEWVLLNQEYFLSLKKEVVILDFSLNPTPPPNLGEKKYFAFPDLWITLPDLKFREKFLTIKKSLFLN